MCFVVSICKTVEVSDMDIPNEAICAGNLQQFYNAFFNSLKDYTLDSRGDVGAWCVWDFSAS